LNLLLYKKGLEFFYTMPFELSESLKNTCGVTFASRGMNGLFCSKFYTTLILTIMILILITVIYPCKKGTPFWVVGKLGIYIFGACFALLFIHDGVMYNSYKNEVAGGADDDFVKVLGGDNNIGLTCENHSIKPTLTHLNNEENAVTDTGGSDEIFTMFGV
jgi:hypothetical protein